MRVRVSPTIVMNDECVVEPPVETEPPVPPMPPVPPAPAEAEPIEPMLLPDAEALPPAPPAAPPWPVVRAREVQRRVVVIFIRVTRCRRVGIIYRVREIIRVRIR